jgi:hypothetical protein
MHDLVNLRVELADEALAGPLDLLLKLVYLLLDLLPAESLKDIEPLQERQQRDESDAVERLPARVLLKDPLARFAVEVLVKNARVV